MQIRLSIKRKWNSNFKLLFFIFSFILLFSFHCLGQNTTVKGKILDAKTFEAVPYVNIAVSGTMLGTMSRITGEFELKLPNQELFEINFSSLGYEVQKLSVANDTFISVLLVPTSIEFDEIVIKPDDTAYSIIKSTVKNKPQYSIEKCSAQAYDMYTKAMVTFRKFNFKKDSSFNTRLFRKEFEAFSILSEDDKVPGIPGYMIESLSKVYTLKSPERVRREVEDMNIEGTVFNQTEMLDELINEQLDINFYENQVQLFGKAFISPLANSGKAFYKFALADTVEVDGYQCIEIYFFPKDKDNLCFSGSLWVTDSTYIPKRISARTSLQTDINFIDNITIHQNFKVIKNTSAPAELRISLTGLNLLIDVLSVKDNYVFSQPKPTSFYSEEPAVAERMGTETKLLEKRQQYFSDYDRVALENLNKLSENKKIKAFSKVVETSITGFYKGKNIDYGPWLLLLSSNEIEGRRLRMGANTTVNFSPNFYTDGYLAYGFKDQKFKGAFSTQYFFDKNKWGLIGFRYGNDLANIGAQNTFEQQDAFFALSSAINGAINVNQIELKSIYGQIDVFQNFTLKASFKQNNYKPRGKEFVFAWFNDDAKTNIVSNFSNTELKTSLSYHPGNHYIIDGNRRFFTGNNSSPVFELAYSKGLKDIFNGDFNYQQIQFSIQQKVFTTGLGYINYLAAYEQTFGQAVYPLLNVLPGNESVWRSWTQFNLIDNGTIVADKLLTARAEWHFDGSIVRKLPLIRLLNVRLLAGGNFAYGTFNEAKNGFYDAQTNPNGILSTFDTSGRAASSFQPLVKDEPYSEVYCGVENIVKIFRVDFIFRTNSYYKNYASAFGVKISGRFAL